MEYLLLVAIKFGIDIVNFFQKNKVRNITVPFDVKKLKAELISFVITRPDLAVCHLSECVKFAVCDIQFSLV